MLEEKVREKESPSAKLLLAIQHSEGFGIA
jgi:hypothetical protein